MTRLLIILLGVTALCACASNGLGDFVTDSVVNTFNDLGKEKNNEAERCRQKARYQGLNEAAIGHHCSSNQISKRREEKEQGTRDDPDELTFQGSGTTLGEQLDSVTDSIKLEELRKPVGPVDVQPPLGPVDLHSHENATTDPALPE